MPCRATPLAVALLTAACSPTAQLDAKAAPIFMQLDPPMRARIIESIGVDGVSMLERSEAFRVRLFELQAGAPPAKTSGGGPVRDVEVNDAASVARVVGFFYDVAGSELPPCKCDPVLSYLVESQTVPAEARVLGDPVSVRVGERQLRRRIAGKPGATLAEILEDVRTP
ncbi:MAG: hypothetical protein AAF721_31845 [Myxococcota bacterium]